MATANAGPATTEPIEEAHSAASASDLYIEKCSGCHGSIGDGKGRGARHLFPPARDFRTESFRLAGNANGVPTPEDVASVIQRGMPGTSMRAYDELSDDERMQLAREVLQRHREGVREQAVRELLEQEEEIDEEEVGQIVDFCVTPGEAVHVPQFGPADSQSIAQGKETYFALGCSNCHGDDGTGVWDTPLYDEQGRPAPPRDLVHEPFRGGDAAESIYMRIVVGMPGTPHPAVADVAEDRLMALVHYCRSLSREPKRVLTNYERAVEASRRLAGWAFEHPLQSGAAWDSR